MLLYGERDLDGGAYCVHKVGEGRIRRLSHLYPKVAQATIGERQSITYRARDGVRVLAFLTLPQSPMWGSPLVLLPHGCPHGVRDTMDFDYWARFLLRAACGAATELPWLRGCGASADRGQWGGLMQTDLEDGVAALGRAGIIDPARVCIVDASYGGYAALAGATLTPDIYRCAVSVAGLSDLPEFLRQREAMFGSESMVSDFWRLSIGDRQDDRERIRNVSPANLADRVRIPILLLHGTDDTIAPIDQSRRMRDRLRYAGKDVRYVELRGDDCLSDAPTRIQMLREIEGFLAQHLPTVPPAAAPH